MRRGKYLEIIMYYNNIFMQTYVALEKVMYKLPVRFIPERIGW